MASQRACVSLLVEAKLVQRSCVSVAGFMQRKSTRCAAVFAALLFLSFPSALRAQNYTQLVSANGGTVSAPTSCATGVPTELAFIGPINGGGSTVTPLPNQSDGLPSGWILLGPNPHSYSLPGFVELVCSNNNVIQQVCMDGSAQKCSANSPKDNGNTSNTPGNCQCVRGDPISIGEGNVFEQVVDYQTSGQNKLSFARSYNSMAASPTFAVALGTNWRSTYDRYLTIQTPTFISIERADGQVLFFYPQWKLVGER